MLGWLEGCSFLVNLIEGVIRLLLLVGYLSLIGLMPDVKRLFGYHGAEHKTINAYEAGAELTPEIVAKYPIEHPRCGTAFLLTVFRSSACWFFGVRSPAVHLVAHSRVFCLFPVIAGISYEIIRFTAKNMHNPIIRVIDHPESGAAAPDDPSARFADDRGGDCVVQACACVRKPTDRSRSHPGSGHNV